MTWSSYHYSQVHARIQLQNLHWCALSVSGSFYGHVALQVACNVWQLHSSTSQSPLERVENINHWHFDNDNVLWSELTIFVWPFTANTSSAQSQIVKYIFIKLATKYYLIWQWHWQLSYNNIWLVMRWYSHDSLLIPLGRAAVGSQSVTAPRPSSPSLTKLSSLNWYWQYNSNPYLHDF